MNDFSFFRSVGRAGEPAAAGAGLGESTAGPELLADSLGSGRRVSKRPGPLGLEYGDPVEEYPGPAQGRGRQRETAGEANQLRERSVAGAAFLRHLRGALSTISLSSELSPNHIKRH